jgi:hypothetical protein
MTKREDELQAQIDALTAKVAELERASVAKSQPAAKFEAGPPTPGTTELAMRNLRMSAQAMAPMLEACLTICCGK